MSPTAIAKVMTTSTTAKHLLRRVLSKLGETTTNVRVVTKAGLARPNGKWVPNGRPEHLKATAQQSCQALGGDSLFLLMLHVRDPNVPFEETLSALAELQATGLVQHLGLCNTSIAEVQQAQRHFPVTAIQNELSVLNRRSANDGLLAWTAQHGIPFLASRPLGGIAKQSKLTANPVLNALAQRHAVSPIDMAIAAVRSTSPNLIPLVGATRMRSVRSSVAATSVQLDVSDLMALNFQFSFQPTQQPGDSVTSPMFNNQDSSTVRVGFSNSLPIGKDPGPSTKPEVVMLMGIQGAGKSELVTQYTQCGYVRLNRDELGGKLDDLVPKMVQLIHSGQQRVILDNTYPTRTSRAPVIQSAATCGLPVRCLFLDTSLNDAQINIAKRMIHRYGLPLGPAEMKMMRQSDPNLPPPQALFRWAASFEMPQLDEGFHRIDNIPFKRREEPDHKNKGLLLDVDGTIRTTQSGEHFPSHPDDIKIMPHRKEVLTRWIEAGYQLFFVSNQGGIAAGHLSHDIAQAAMFRTAELLGVPITEIVYCPHPTTPVGCFCRKPMPGLGVYLMERHQLSRDHLVMVGDRDTDAGFAQAIGAQYHDATDFFAGIEPPKLG